MLSIVLTKEGVKHIGSGSPWVFVSMIQMTSELETSDPGILVNILDSKAKPFAIGYFNPKSQLACRILSTNPNTAINQTFFANLFVAALNKRNKDFSVPYYRLIHSESDNLGGLIIDRFGDILVCQISTAGMENLKPLWLPALEELLKPTTIIYRNDIPVRSKEGLEQSVYTKGEEPTNPIEVLEHECIYYANLLSGQKTGWFYDQRANRNYFAGLVKGKKVLDIYSHSGGFGIAAAKSSAAQVTLVDSSALALELAQKAAVRNNIGFVCEFVRSDAYEYLEKCAEKFDCIMADPPAFIKERKYIASGLKGYQKLAFLCVSKLVPDGIFAIASCSHHASARDFRKAVETGIAKTGRKFALIHKAGADKDHPVHPSLPESQYLKFMVFKID
jgi:23S rRNA (cytosine1962-C5)-methyltransferase